MALSREERLRRKREYERKRRLKIKQDPERKAVEESKKHAQYIKRKIQNKGKLTKRDLRQQRKNWREKNENIELE